MKRKTMAIVDEEHGYAYYFMEYFNRQRSLPFEITAFTKKDVFIDYAEENKVSLLLISDKMMDKEIEAFVEGSIILLSEGESCKSFKAYENVYKYQSSERLIREILDIYARESKEESRLLSPLKKSYTIGVYSPIARVGKTAFSLVAGQILAEEKTALYINMEEYSGFESVFQKNYEHTFDELLYYVKDKDKSFIYKLKSMVYHVGKLDYIAPARNPADFFYMKGQDWKELFYLLQSEGDYGALIIDFGDGVDDLFELLGLCDIVYMPVREDEISQAKILQFENLLQMWAGDTMPEKIRKISLPKAEKKLQAEELLWSKFGQAVREILRKE